MHHRLEAELATFLGTESAILYAQAFAAVSSVIPAFAKRGDIIVADRGVNFAINKGLQISRSQIKWYAHGDMKDLERVLQTVERERKRKGGKLTRKFIVAEGIFENDGMMLDLPRVVSDETGLGSDADARSNLVANTNSDLCSMRASHSEWSAKLVEALQSTTVSQ